MFSVLQNHCLLINRYANNSPPKQVLVFELCRCGFKIRGQRYVMLNFILQWKVSDLSPMIFLLFYMVHCFSKRSSMLTLSAYKWTKIWQYLADIEHSFISYRKWPWVSLLQGHARALWYWCVLLFHITVEKSFH